MLVDFELCRANLSSDVLVDFELCRAKLSSDELSYTELNMSLFELC